MSLAREPSEPPAIPAHAGTPNRQILFRHPGYGDSNNVLLKLFAPDLGQNSTGRGLYAQYALEACGIIAGNRREGWLSEVKDPGASARIDPTSILRKGVIISIYLRYRGTLILVTKMFRTRLSQLFANGAFHTINCPTYGSEPVRQVATL